MLKISCVLLHHCDFKMATSSQFYHPVKINAFPLKFPTNTYGTYMYICQANCLELKSESSKSLFYLSLIVSEKVDARKSFQLVLVCFKFLALFPQFFHSPFLVNLGIL